MNAPSAVSVQGASEPQSRALQSYLAGKPFQSKWNAYYSRIRIVASAGSTAGAGGGYTVASGPELIAFGYARGTDMGPGGQPGTLATYADTNIQTPSQTVAGEGIEIDGVGMIVLGQSDAQLLKALDQCVSVKVRMNGNTDYPMGIPSMVPSPGGLFGNSEAASMTPDQLSTVGIIVGAMSNGLPHISNYYPLPEPMIWAPAGHPDSTLNIVLKVERTAVTNPAYNTATRVAVAGGATTPGTAGFVPPNFANVWVDWMVVVIGRTVLGLSDN